MLRRISLSDPAYRALMEARHRTQVASVHLAREHWKRFYQRGAFLNLLRLSTYAAVTALVLARPLEPNNA